MWQKPLVERAKRPRIEMVPLIDMFFLLLIFFIFGVFSMSMQQGLLVDLPTAASAAPSQTASLTVSLAADGSAFLNQEPVRLEALEAALRRQPGYMPTALVVLNADRQVPHGTVITALDAIRQAGLQRVSFQAAPEKFDDPTP